MKPVILTGIRANNELTIGNYFGALLPLIDMAQHRANEFKVNLMLADLHSFITPIDHAELQENIMQTLRVFVAAGLPMDNDDIRLFRQSYVPAHSELTWILDCFTGMGEMGRMTQFKDKASRLSEDRINVGLFNYPVLMACDILLYDTLYVPVGDDQTQHLEYTRDIAERMNNQFGQLFTVPKPVKEQHAFFGKDQGLRIKDLQDPSKKMSKSDETGKGVIFLTDNLQEVGKKINSATTDSFGKFDPANPEQTGLRNLIQICALASGRSVEEVTQQYAGMTKYGEIKKDVAVNMANFLGDFQERLAKVDDAAILAKLEKDEVAMREQADKVLLKVQRAVGLRP